MSEADTRALKFAADEALRRSTIAGRLGAKASSAWWLDRHYRLRARQPTVPRDDVRASGGDGWPTREDVAQPGWADVANLLARHNVSARAAIQIARDIIALYAPHIARANARIAKLRRERDETLNHAGAISRARDRRAEAAESEAATLRAQLAEATRAQIYWLADDPEEGFDDPEFYADQTGERELIFEVQRAHRLPNKWIAARWNETVSMWEIEECESEAEAAAFLAKHTGGADGR